MLLTESQILIDLLDGLIVIQDMVQENRVLPNILRRHIQRRTLRFGLHLCMSEPEYIFKKGDGWVTNSQPDEIYCENLWGRYKIVNRLPEVGERYGVFSFTNIKYVEGDKLRISVWAEYLSTKNIPHTDFSIRHKETGSDYFENASAVFCTLLVLEEYARPQ